MFNQWRGPEKGLSSLLGKMEKEIKVRGVAKRHGVQSYLRRIKEGQDHIIQLYNEGKTIILQTEILQHVPVGEVADHEAMLLESLHGTPIRAVVTGGETLVLDPTGQEVAQVRDINVLSPEQQVLILNGMYRTQKKYYGLSITFNQEHGIDNQ
jgi:hypothetical protein